MGTTLGGLPYPESTDPVAEGAAAIQALAEAIDLDVLTVLDGTWKPWTPAYTNLTVGNATQNVGRYYRIGPLLFFTASLTFGTTTAMSTGPFINNLPLLVESQSQAIIRTFDATSAAGRVVGAAAMIGANVNNWSGPTGWISATVPFTWDTSDAIHFAGWGFLQAGQ